MFIWFKNILFITPLFLLAFSCKKDSKNEPNAVPPNNSVPCNATNLVVDSIIENMGESKIYKLTIKNHTITPPSGSVTIISAVEHVTITVLGDTMVNSALGKRYNIKGTNGWDFKAYSYKNAIDSLWRFIPLDGSYVDLFNIAIKLPIQPDSNYTVVSNNQTYINSVDSSFCQLINYQNLPVYSVASFLPMTSNDIYYRVFTINKSGILNWSFIMIFIQTQNPYQKSEEWQFEKIN
jgi:hypothetical protein